MPIRESQAARPTLLLAPRPLALTTGHSTWTSDRDLHHSTAPLCSACATSRPRPTPRATWARPHQRTSSTDLSRHRWRLVDRWMPIVDDQEGTRRARGRSGGLCCSGRAGASSSSPPPPLGLPPRPSLARASSSRRFEDATMSLLDSLARRTVPHNGWKGVSSGAGAGGRPRAAHLDPCTSLSLSLLVSQGSSMHSCAPVRRALTSFIVRAGQSRPRWHPLPFSSRKLALSLAGRLSTAPVGAHRVSRESCRAQAAERCPSRRPYSSRRLRESSRRGRVPTRPYPPSRAPEGSGCTLVSRSHGHCPCGMTVRPATS